MRASKFLEKTFLGHFSTFLAVVGFQVAVRVSPKMFLGCVVFNQDIGYWKVSSVENMEYMFSDCRNFNQGLLEWRVKTRTVDGLLVSEVSGQNMFERCISDTYLGHRSWHRF